MILRAVFRYLLRTPWSSAMALLGVALAVTSIVSVHLISAVVVERLDRLLPAQLLEYSHFLHRQEAAQTDVLEGYFELRQRWRSGLLAGVTRVGPIIDESITLAGRSVRLLGLDLLGGSPMQTADTPTSEETVTRRLSWQGVWVSEDLEDIAPRPINGVLEVAEGLILADIGVAQSLLGWPDTRISYVGLKYDSSASRVQRVAERILPGFGAGLPRTQPQSPLEAWTIREFSEQNPTAEFGRSVLFNISALALLALLVSWFLIYQVAVSWLRRLWSTLERLHVLGVDRWRLATTFVGMLGLVGIVAGIAGIYLGLLLGEFLYEIALGSAAVDAPQLVVDGWVVGKALVSALLVCTAGSVVAYRNKVAADDQGRVRRSIVRSWLTMLSVIAFIGIAAWGVFVENAGLVGAFSAIAVVSLCVALCARPMLVALRRHARSLGGNYFLRLGLRETVWYPQELSVALSGLVLAVATAIGVSLMVDSFRGDFEKLLERRLSYEFAISGPASQLRETLTWTRTRPQATQKQADLRDAENDQSGALRADGFWRDAQRVAGLPVEIIYTPLDVPQAARYGVERAIDTDEVLVSEQFVRAVRRHSGEALGVGDRVALGSRSVRIAGIFGSFGDLQPRMILNAGTQPRGHLYSVNVAVSPTVDVEKLVEEIRARGADIEVQRQADIKTQALATFDQTFAITSVLITISMLVAGIGVYVAVTTLRLNRATSTRLLYTLGISRVEAMMGDLARALGIAGLAVLLAVPLGLVLGWILCAVVNPRAFGWVVQLSLSANAIVVPVFWGLLAAIIAGTVRLGRAEEGNLDARNA